MINSQSSPWDQLVKIIKDTTVFDDTFASCAKDIMKAQGKKIQLPSAQVVLIGGDPSADTYLLLSGRIYILRYTHDGRRIIPDILQAPQFLGLSEALSKETEYKATVATLSPCVLLRFHKKDFLQGIQDSQDFSLYLLEYFANLAGNLMENSGQKMFASGLENLVLYLHHQCMGKNLPVEIQDTKAFLADLLNINKRTLYRYLDAFEKEKVIRRVGQSLIIGRDNHKALMDKIHRMNLLD